jgi:hypothetical protein
MWEQKGCRCKVFILRLPGVTEKLTPGAAPAKWIYNSALEIE